MIKTGLFGGAFDPVHNGHISLAKAAADRYGLHKLVFIPTKTPPHKKAHSASGADRFNMLRIVSESLGHKFQVSDIELKARGVSYTYNTIEKWRIENPEDDIYFISGSDIFATIESWYRWQDIFGLAKFIVAKRAGFEFGKMLADMGDDIKNFEKQGRILLFDTEIDNVSSTFIRNKGNIESCLVPEAVLKYIEKHKLYEGNK